MNRESKYFEHILHAIDRLALETKEEIFDLEPVGELFTQLFGHSTIRLTPHPGGRSLDG